LSKLPGRDLARLVDRAELVEAGAREAVYEPGGPIENVFFPLGCVFSTVGQAGRFWSVEVATVGREGMAGLPVFLGATSTPHASFCQVPGPALRLASDDLRRALGEGGGTLHQLLSRFTQATIVQIAQNVVCNNTHLTPQRAARWLLTTHDRIDREEFPLTQEFFSQMLGVRRPTASEAAGRLQDEGMIRYQRGVVTVLDRGRLERTACSCYAVVKSEFDALVASN
jgi:hypothetical protein